MTLLDAETLPTTQRAEISISHLVPLSIRERVTVAPPPDWVVPRTVNEHFRPEMDRPVTVLLLDAQSHAGQRLFYRRTVQRMESLGGIQSQSQWRLESFDPRTQRLTLHSVVVRREGRNTDQARADRILFLQRENGLDRNQSLDGCLTLVLLLEDVRVGDIIDASYTLESIPQLMPERFWDGVSLPWQTPVGEVHYSIRFPTDSGMRHKQTSNMGERSIETIGSDTRWSWTRRKIIPLEPEPNLPSWRPDSSGIEVSNCTSWGEIAAGACAAWHEQFDTQEVVECARAIAAAHSTLAERVNRAITFVQDEIRYLSLMSDDGGQIPASPGLVLRRRFGDCKDKSFLLVHLLRWFGVPARPVLVHSARGRALENSLPSPNAFDHAIVEYELESRRRWVDTTLSFQGGSAFTRHLPHFHIGLPIGPEVAGLESISISPSSDFYELRELFRLDTTGRPSIMTVSVHAGGKEAEELRRQIGIYGGEAISRLREQHYRRLFPDARRYAKLEWFDDRKKNEFRLMEAYEMPRAVVSVAERSGYLFRYASYLMQNLLDTPDSQKRWHPYALPQVKKVDHWIDLESPALPRGESGSVQKRDESFRFVQEVKKLFGRWSFHYTVRFLEDEIPGIRFDKYREKTKEILPSTVISVVLPEGISAPQGLRRNRRLPAQTPAPASSGKNGKHPGNPGEQAQLTDDLHAARLLLAEPAPSLASSPQIKKSVGSQRLSPRMDVRLEEPAPVERSEDCALVAETSWKFAPSRPASSSDATEPKSRSSQDKQRSRRKRPGNSFRRIIAMLLAIFAIATAYVWVRALKGHGRPPAVPANAALQNPSSIDPTLPSTDRTVGKAHGKKAAPSDDDDE